MVDKLKGEGDKITYIMARRECEECDEPATWRHTYLLPNARSNPASSAYRKDDCSWCSDEEEFFCTEHAAKARNEHSVPLGYTPCSYFPCEDRFAHMFLRKEKVEEGD